MMSTVDDASFFVFLFAADCYGTTNSVNRKPPRDDTVLKQYRGGDDKFKRFIKRGKMFLGHRFFFFIYKYNSCLDTSEAMQYDFQLCLSVSTACVVMVVIIFSFFSVHRRRTFGATPWRTTVIVLLYIIYAV